MKPQSTKNQLQFKIHLDKFDKTPYLQLHVPTRAYRDKITIPIRKNDSWLITQIVELINTDNEDKPLTRSRFLITLLESALKKHLFELPLDARFFLAKAADDLASYDTINLPWVRDVLINESAFLNTLEAIENCEEMLLPIERSLQDTSQISHSDEYLTFLGAFEGD